MLCAILGAASMVSSFVSISQCQRVCIRYAVSFLVVWVRNCWSFTSLGAVSPWEAKDSRALGGARVLSHRLSGRLWPDAQENGEKGAILRVRRRFSTPIEILSQWRLAA